jgi:hypothetical protein
MLGYQVHHPTRNGILECLKPLGLPDSALPGIIFQRMQVPCYTTSAVGPHKKAFKAKLVSLTACQPATACQLGSLAYFKSLVALSYTT